MPAKEVPSVWARPPRRKREQPALSREQIVGEALRLLDAEGIDALSMRRLGSALGAVATAVYWHVANKEELIELVIDEVIGEIEVPIPADPAEWRSAVRHCAHSFRSVILRHPWIVSVLDAVGLAYLGPNMMQVFERMITTFEVAGFDLPEVDQSVSAVVSYVVGAATADAAAMTRITKGGQSEQEWLDSLHAAASEAMKGHPKLEKLYTAFRGQDPAKTREATFEYGLDRLLDGLATRL